MRIRDAVMIKYFTENPQTQMVLASFLGALILGFIVALTFVIIKRVKGKKSDVLVNSFLMFERGPVALISAELFVLLTFPFHNYAAKDDLVRATVIITIISFMWFFLKLNRVIKEIVHSRFPIDKKDNIVERKVRTKFQYIQVILSIIIILVGVALIIYQFESIRIIGTGLLASAGIIGIIIAFSANQTLSNLIAGFQLAFTQPFRIDDVVIVEGEWGRIEEITLTYVVVRIWDQRRMVLPITYFINNPFQNWTRTSAEILGTVFLYVDYSVPVEEVRNELKRIVETIDLWDGRVAIVQVTDTSERTVTLRALVSAANASDAWELRCKVREKLISFLQRNYPDSLPRIRIEEEEGQKSLMESPQ